MPWTVAGCFLIISEEGDGITLLRNLFHCSATLHKEQSPIKSHVEPHILYMKLHFCPCCFHENLRNAIRMSLVPECYPRLQSA